MADNNNPSSCGGNCESCGASCSERNADPFKIQDNPYNSIKKVIGVVSGKGGVGKSLVTSLSAIAASRIGLSTAVLDADITGPSIPKIFGIKNKAFGDENGSIIPVETETGIKLMSVNLILENETDPVAWRGPIISGVVKQFWTDVIWGDVDCMLVDMPPGTGDVMLTVFQSLPLDGIILVTSPQELVNMVVEKAVGLAGQMNVPILGVVENLSYALCPKCGERIDLFGKSRTGEICEKYGLEKIAEIPVLPEISDRADSGTLENIDLDCIDDLAKVVRAVQDATS